MKLLKWSPKVDVGHVISMVIAGITVIGMGYASQRVLLTEIADQRVTNARQDVQIADNKRAIDELRAIAKGQQEMAKTLVGLQQESADTKKMIAENQQHVVQLLDFHIRESEVRKR
jgi:hypothetical protein